MEKRIQRDFEKTDMPREISIHNADCLCCELHCGSKPTHFVSARVFNLPMALLVCKKHATYVEKHFFDCGSPKYLSYNATTYSPI